MSGALEELSHARTVRGRQRLLARALRFLARIELLFDRVIWGLRRRYGRLGPLQLVSYRGFGSAAGALLRGRVLEASVLERSLPTDSTFRNFRRMLRRFFSRELPHATVRATFGACAVSASTDDEGYFELSLVSPELEGPEAWKHAELEVVAAPVRGLTKAYATAEILIPGAEATLVIVSDIDDTVLQTHVTQKLKMIWTTLSGSAYTRMPFAGTSQLYHALARGQSGHAVNPVFYVSKSPWNLYDFLSDFLEFHALPRGPLLLRDIGLREAPPVDHKSAAVQQLLEMYPKLPFVLIGDSGERDPEIYLEAAARHPGRVAAIYLRDLGGKSRTHDAQGRARLLCERARAHGTEMLWIEHASQALSHAEQHGLARRAAE